MPVTEFETAEKYRYQNGFGCHFESEAVEGALPIGQNSPQRAAYGLYAEKLSGTAFTAPRHENKQTWLYRILPSCAHPPFRPASGAEADGGDGGGDGGKLHYLPNQLRWDPFDRDGAGDVDFVSGLRLVAGAGDPALKQGLGVLVYAAGRGMAPTAAFSSADGDLLIVPQEGALELRTELGWLLVRPMEVAVVPRGVKYRVGLVDGPARGYALELYQGHFALPELGPIGSNGLANARDFQAPVACFDADAGPTASAPASAAEYVVTTKFRGRLFETRQPHTPFDVVAWQGNYYPYKYDLGRFNAIGSVSFDHPDPSIFTVLSAPSATPGTAVADFVVFPPRWLVAEATFRPPWYHRNTMSEFMGLVRGDYDAKRPGAGGFQPGGASLHNVMAGHGPDAASCDAARDADLRPQKVGDGSCAFMFESCLMLGVSEWGLRTCKKVQQAYSEESWGAVRTHWQMPADKAVVSHLLNK
ncbi:hypothetical protein CDD83_596 [Cordyceps sp. RAO-2017]|nr:hypothetical protein CDD83_596 [Cordyceps sp. RAO-2017]